MLFLSHGLKSCLVLRDIISLYSHCISIASSVLTDTKYGLLLSIGYLHLGLLENIFVFINRNEDRSDVAQKNYLSSLRVSSE